MVIPNNDPALRALLIWYDADADEVLSETRALVGWELYCDENGPEGETMSVSRPLCFVTPARNESLFVLDTRSGQVEDIDALHPSKDAAMAACLAMGRKEHKRDEAA